MGEPKGRCRDSGDDPSRAYTPTHTSQGVLAEWTEGALCPRPDQAPAEPPLRKRAPEQPPGERGWGAGSRKLTASLLPGEGEGLLQPAAQAPAISPATHMPLHPAPVAPSGDPRLGLEPEAACEQKPLFWPVNAGLAPCKKAQQGPRCWWWWPLLRCKVVSDSVPTDRSTPGFPVPHRPLKFAQTHVH